MLFVQYFLLGILSTIPLGPVGLHVVESHTSGLTNGIKALAGFVCVELMYMFIAINSQVYINKNFAIIEGVANTLFSLLLIVVGFSILKSKKGKRATVSKRAFMKSITLGSLNPGILIFYVGLCTYHSGLNTEMSLLSVCISFVLGTIFTFTMIFTFRKKLAYKLRNVIDSLKKLLGVAMISHAVYLITFNII